MGIGKILGRIGRGAGRVGKGAASGAAVVAQGASWLASNGAQTAVSTLQLVELIDNITPHIDDDVVVEVVGQPGALKQQLYWLALNTAFGLARPAQNTLQGLPPPVALMVEYDAAENYVRCTLRYRVGAMSLFTQGVIGATSQLFGVGGNIGLDPNNLKAIKSWVQNLQVIQGPNETIYGVSPLVPFIVAYPFPFGLPFSNKTILTTLAFCSSPDPALGGVSFPNSPDLPSIYCPNPQPSGDNRSRGSTIDPTVSGPATVINGTGNIPFSSIVSDWLIPMVFSALTDPGSTNLETFSVPKFGPTATSTPGGPYG